MRGAYLTILALALAGLAIVASSCVDVKKIDAQIGEIQSQINEAVELREQIVAQAVGLPPEQVKALGLESQLRVIDATVQNAKAAIGNLNALKEAAVSPDEFVLSIGQVLGIFIPGAGAVGVLAAKAVKGWKAASSLAESTVAVAAEDPDFAQAIKLNARLLDSKQTKDAKKLIDKAQEKYGKGKRAKGTRNG